ncbi:MAG TPA: DUF2330 domain-containing protein [Polyangiaceae bacterium]|nr:DUF2330 domain-containing protein [Polyangiaceae bacterium]
MRGIFLGSLVGLGAVAGASIEGDARACGGCFHPPAQSGTVVTDHRMVFSISPQTTTLYDEIEYAGSPASFAWVLPIHGPVRVSLSSDLLFGALEQVTKTTIVAPPNPCPCACFKGGAMAANAPPPVAPSGGGGGLVTVIAQQVVGPYDTVQLQSTDPSALTNWLTANSYTIPTNIQPVIAAYVKEGFDFLAMRLSPGQGVQAMRPVSVTSSGASLSLPLRMVAAGTGATVGITLWVVGQGRYEPQNFQQFTILPSDIVWDWSKNDSNYSTLQMTKEAALSNAAWQIESSLDVSPSQVQNLVLVGPATPQYTDIPSTDAGPGETAEQVRAADLATLFPEGGSSVRITRMRSDLAQAALANDLVLEASSDQSTLSSVYQTTQSINAPQCPACPCGATSGGLGSSGSSSGFPFGSTGTSSTGASSAFSGSPSGSFSGSASSASPGEADGGTGGSKESFGCTTSSASDSSPPGWLWLAAAGFVGAAFMRRTRHK